MAYALAELLRRSDLAYEAKPRAAPLLRLPAELAPKERRVAARAVQSARVTADKSRAMLRFWTATRGRRSRRRCTGAAWASCAGLASQPSSDERQCALQSHEPHAAADKERELAVAKLGRMEKAAAGAAEKAPRRARTRELARSGWTSASPSSPPSLRPPPLR